MGQFSCKGWDCKNSDLKLDCEFRNSDFSYQGVKRVNSSKKDTKFYTSNITALVKIQSAIKAFICRQRYKRILKQCKPNFFYFNSEEVAYFLSKKSQVALHREETKGRLYNHGGIYSGEMLGGFRDGKGTMQWKDGARYTGSWSYGRPFGPGSFLFPDGESFQGQWTNYFSKGSENDITGLGLILWKEKVSDGFQWLWYKKAICLNSPISISMTPRNEEKVQRLQESYQTFKSFHEKNLSEIRCSKDSKEKKYPDGSVYKGDLQGSKRQGFGKILWADGDWYEGEWKDDHQSGWGKNVWKEGSSYFGFFLENLKHGVGRYCWNDGTEYFGEWKANKMTGIGKYSWMDGKMYLGEWFEGNMQGFGVLMFRDGRKYEGEWSKGKKHGEGLTFFTNGRVSRDLWMNGKIIRPDV